MIESLKLNPMTFFPMQSTIILAVDGGFETGILYVKAEYHQHLRKWGYFYNTVYYMAQPEKCLGWLPYPKGVYELISNA